MRPVIDMFDWMMVGAREYAALPEPTRAARIACDEPTREEVRAAELANEPTREQVDAAAESYDRAVTVAGVCP